MYIDSQTEFSADQAITVTSASTNVVDLGNDSSLVKALNEKGGKILCQVTETFTASGSATLTVALQTSDTEGSGYATVLTTPAIAKATLVEGYNIFGGVTLPFIDKQYARLNFTVATGPMTAGKIEAGIVLDVQSNG